MYPSGGKIKGCVVVAVKIVAAGPNILAVFLYYLIVAYIWMLHSC